MVDISDERHCSKIGHRCARLLVALKTILLWEGKDKNFFISRSLLELMCLISREQYKELAFDMPIDDKVGRRIEGEQACRGREHWENSGKFLQKPQVFTGSPSSCGMPVNWLLFGIMYFNSCMI